MLRIYRILVSVLALASSTVGLGIGLSGCGQQGPLYFPTESAAAGRATLPQTLRPKSTASSAPATIPASTPAPVSQ